MDQGVKNLTQQLLEACMADVIDFRLVEELLKQGAEPLGRVKGEYCDDNLYGAIAEKLFQYDETTEDFFRITDLFLKYGMDITKPSIPYDYSYVFHPLLCYIYRTNEWGIRTLQLFLDNGCSAKDAREFWQYAIGDYRYCPHDLEIEELNDFVRKLMLVASYPHIFNSDEELRKEIWYDYNCNGYDITQFRNWNDYVFDVDTSHCEHGPEVYKSVVTIIEKTSGSPVWKFGICLSPDDV
jgi:hypothetical protein